MSSSSERTPRARTGFVLLEAVVALAIIGLVAVALLSTTGTQLRTTSKASVLLTARSLAEDRLAALRFLGYDQLQDVPDSLRSGRFAPPFDDFEWTAAAEEMEDEYDLFGVEVTVTGQGESFPLRTLVHAPRPALVTNATGATGGRGGTGGGRAGGEGRGGQTDRILQGRGGIGTGGAAGGGATGRAGAGRGRGG